MSNDFNFDIFINEEDHKAAVDVTKISTKKPKYKKMYIADVKFSDLNSSYFVYREQKNSDLSCNEIKNIEELISIIKESNYSKTVDINSQEFKEVFNSLKEKVLEKMKDQIQEEETEEYEPIKMVLKNEKKHD